MKKYYCVTFLIITMAQTMAMEKLQTDLTALHNKLKILAQQLPKIVISTNQCDQKLTQLNNLYQDYKNQGASWDRYKLVDVEKMISDYLSVGCILPQELQQFHDQLKSITELPPIPFVEEEEEEELLLSSQEEFDKLKDELKQKANEYKETNIPDPDTWIKKIKRYQRLAGELNYQPDKKIIDFMFRSQEALKQPQVQQKQLTDLKKQLDDELKEYQKDPQKFAETKGKKAEADWSQELQRLTKKWGPTSEEVALYFNKKGDMIDRAQRFALYNLLGLIKAYEEVTTTADISLTDVKKQLVEALATQIINEYQIIQQTPKNYNAQSLKYMILRIQMYLYWADKLNLPKNDWESRINILNQNLLDACQNISRLENEYENHKDSVIILKNILIEIDSCEKFAQELHKSVDQRVLVFKQKVQDQLKEAELYQLEIDLKFEYSKYTKAPNIYSLQEAKDIYARIQEYKKKAAALNRRNALSVFEQLLITKFGKNQLESSNP